MATYDYFDNSAILASDRSYTATSNPASTLYPSLKRNSLLLSGHQDLTPSVRLTADVIYKLGDMPSVRGLLAVRTITNRGRVVDNEFYTFGVAPTMED